MMAGGARGEATDGFMSQLGPALLSVVSGGRRASTSGGRDGTSPFLPSTRQFGLSENPWRSVYWKAAGVD